MAMPCDASRSFDKSGAILILILILFLGMGISYSNSASK